MVHQPPTHLCSSGFLLFSYSKVICESSKSCQFLLCKWMWKDMKRWLSTPTMPSCSSGTSLWAAIFLSERAWSKMNYWAGIMAAITQTQRCILDIMCHVDNILFPGLTVIHFPLSCNLTTGNQAKQDYFTLFMHHINTPQKSVVLMVNRWAPLHQPHT